MALIEKQKKGREDGGYTRIFGIKTLGALISQVHATSVSAGTELEKLILKAHTLTMDGAMLADFLNKRLLNGTYLIPKKLIKQAIKGAIESDSEPDFLIIVVVDKKAYVVELKDGDTFDTKKAAGEIASCKKFAGLLQAFFMKNNLSYEVSIKICSFNQTSHEKIIEGFKGHLKKSEAWTGKELCKILSISYDNIIKQREVHQQHNLQFFVERLLEIDGVGELIKTKANDQASQSTQSTI